MCIIQNKCIWLKLQKMIFYASDRKGWSWKNKKRVLKQLKDVERDTRDYTLGGEVRLRPERCTQRLSIYMLLWPVLSHLPGIVTRFVLYFPVSEANKFRSMHIRSTCGWKVMFKEGRWRARREWKSQKVYMAIGNIRDTGGAWEK